MKSRNNKNKKKSPLSSAIVPESSPPPQLPSSSEKSPSSNVAPPLPPVSPPPSLTPPPTQGGTDEGNSSNGAVTAVAASEENREEKEAIERARWLNEEARAEVERREELDALRPELVAWIEELRSNVDAAASPAALDQACERIVDSLVARYYKNRLAYEKVLCGATSVVMLYAAKKFFIQLNAALLQRCEQTEEKNAGTSALLAHLQEQIRELTTPGIKFMFPREFLDSLFRDTVHTFERASSADPVRVLRMGDLLYPQNFHLFERCIPDADRPWLRQSAARMLDDLARVQASGEVAALGAEEYLARLRQHLTRLASGDLPWDYMSETESGSPQRLLLFIDMLNPDTEPQFTNRSMTAEEFDYVHEHASSRLAAFRSIPEGAIDEAYRQRVIGHLHGIVENRVPPFGYCIETTTTTTEKK